MFALVDSPQCAFEIWSFEDLTGATYRFVPVGETCSRQSDAATPDGAASCPSRRPAGSRTVHVAPFARRAITILPHPPVLRRSVARYTRSVALSTTAVPPLCCRHSNLSPLPTGGRSHFHTTLPQTILPHPSVLRRSAARYNRSVALSTSPVPPPCRHRPIPKPLPQFNIPSCR